MKDTIKKILLDVGVFTISGIICMVVTVMVARKVLAPPPVPKISHAGEEVPPTDPKAEGGGAGEEKKAEGGGHGEEKKAEASGEGGGGDAKATGGSHYELRSVIVNLSDEGVRRYAKATLTLHLKEDDLGEKIKEQEPQIYDLLIKIISNYKFKEISSTQGKEALKEEVRSRLNSSLGHGGIERVYLTELIIQ